MKGRENPSGDPHAKLVNTNGSTDAGCFQINLTAQKNRIRGRDVWDAVDNSRIAYDVFHENGNTFAPWCGSERAGLVPRGKDWCHGGH